MADPLEKYTAGLAAQTLSSPKVQEAFRAAVRPTLFTLGAVVFLAALGGAFIGGRIAK